MTDTSFTKFYVIHKFYRKLPTLLEQADAIKSELEYSSYTPVFLY